MKRVLILSGIAWNDTLQRHQRISNFLSKNNCQILFIENIISSKFTIKKALKSFFYTNKNLYNKNKVPLNVNIYNKRFLNPHSIFKYYNHIQAKKLLKDIGNKFDVIINYLPIETTNYILSKCSYKSLIYDCVRDFENWGGYPIDIKNYEKVLYEKSNYILVDSYYLKNKIISKNLEEKLIQILPTVDIKEYQIYKKNFNIELKKIKRLTYFGTIGKHINIKLLNYISKYFEINIIGKIENNIEISSKIKVHDFINDFEELANKIINISDGIIIPYSGNMDGVIPAKLMQSLATGLPVFINYFYDSKILDDKVYTFKEKEELKKIIDNFNYKEFNNRKNKYKQFIEQNIEENSFEILKKIIFR